MLYFTSQLKHLIISLIVFSIFAWGISVRHLNTYTFVFYGFTILLLLVVLINGHTAGGSQRWIAFAGIRFQPSETAKIVIIAMFVAKFFYNNKQMLCIHIERPLAPRARCVFNIHTYISSARLRYCGPLPINCHFTTIVCKNKFEKSQCNCKF